MPTSAFAVEVITLPVSQIRHKTPVGARDVGVAQRLDLSRGDYASFADFADPDGNAWILQERDFRQTPEQG